MAIDANTFVDSSGKAVEGAITLKVVKAFSFKDMIGSGLSTVADDRTLQTAGMIYVNASYKNEPLAINEDKSITMNWDRSTSFLDAQVFLGNFDSNGAINWSPEWELNDYFFTVPFELLDMNNGSWECYYNDEHIGQLTNPKFNDSYISTEEFEFRMNVFSASSCQWMHLLADEIIDIYISNIDNNLHYADSLIASHIYLRFGKTIDTTGMKEFDFSPSMWQTYLYESAIAFHQQKLKRPVNFYELGIVDSTKTKDLVERGYPVNEATKLINLFKIRKETIRSRRAEDEVRKLRSYTFSVTELGWVNVDRFLNDPQAMESKFLVSIDTEDSLDYVSVQLIIPQYSVVLSANETVTGQYSFTSKREEYRKLPIGQEAILVALSLKNKTPLFVLKNIKIPVEGNITLEMSPTNAEHIKAELSRIDS